MDTDRHLTITVKAHIKRCICGQVLNSFYIFLNSLHDKPDDTTPFLKTLALLLTVYFLLLDHIVPNF